MNELNNNDDKTEPSAQPVVRVQQDHSKTVNKILLLVAGMFCFAFALVPLYDVFCKVTGLNGKPSNEAAVYSATEIDETRTITVDFITRTNSDMPWEFTSQVRKIDVHPGQMNEVAFYVRNPTSRDIIAQAVPSVSPGTAALYLNKTECFCFKHQPLKAGDEAVFPMVFYVDPQLPKDITFFTLQYTLYDITETVDKDAVEVAMN
ncbi:MAG: cytochrome c oxidase assembly protein subunit 11 [Alphaproteobacteria bacterium]|jgi:cytochrome c oxidase assembly protein subunit 11